MVTSINKVSNKNIIFIWNVTTFAEEFENVPELTVNITANVDWGFDWLNVRFLDKELFDFEKELTDLIFGEGFALHSGF